jgi:probable rRNA maturation factor
MDAPEAPDDEHPYAIRVSRAVPARGVRSARIVAALRAALAAEKCPRADLSVALVDDDTIARLHEEHLNIAGPTDVLTFDLRDGDGTGLDGEIVLSVDTAAREAAARGHSLEAEVILYAVHGVLHLLGYDDHTRAAARRMHAREDELLTELGVGAVYGGKQ